MPETEHTESERKAFKDRSLRTIATNDDLDNYLRGNSRSVWVALGIIIVLLIVLLIWVDSASPLFLSSLLFGE